MQSDTVLTPPTSARAFPVWVGVEFAHAFVAVLSEASGLDVLHIKGPAVHESLRRASDPDSSNGGVRLRPASTDADILVRPSHVAALLDVLTRHGWCLIYPFAQGSAFAHAATLEHPVAAPVDLHRHFPGIGLASEAAFDVLWTARSSSTIAGIECQVPGIDAQRLLLMLHAVRARMTGDIGRVWDHAPHEARRDVERLSQRLHAEVAFAAAIGRLDEYRGRREYALWRAIADGETARHRLWLARVRAEATPIDKARTAVRLVSAKPTRLLRQLGRVPSRREQLESVLGEVRVAGRQLRIELLRRRADK